VALIFIGGGNWSTQRKPLTCHKSMTNFITLSSRSVPSCFKEVVGVVLTMVRVVLVRVVFGPSCHKFTMKKWSWHSFLLVEGTGVPRENHWPAISQWQTLLHNHVSSTPHLSAIRTHNFSGDRHWCTGITENNSTVCYFNKVRYLFGMNNQLTLPRTEKLFYFKITSS
jgi:hypothetical protein